MLKESNLKQLKDAIHKEDTIVLVYTTMCGTCENAKVMLNVVSETFKDKQFLKINANLNQSIINEYDISSVPCFLFFQNGLVVEQFYAFHSVTYLYQKVMNFFQSL